jgi:hypothetical protein
MYCFLTVTSNSCHAIDVCRGLFGSCGLPRARVLQFTRPQRPNLATAAMASHLFATSCAEIEDLPQEANLYSSHEQSLYAAIAKAADNVAALPKKQVAQEMKWQTLRLAVEVADLVNSDLWNIVGDHYERCHDIFDEQREHRPMHNGSYVWLDLGPLVWETIPCSGGSAPVGLTNALGGSAPGPKTVRWYRDAGTGPNQELLQFHNGRNHHTPLQDEKSTWFPCVSHALASGINAVVKLPSCAPGAPLNLHCLEFPESKLLDLIQHQQVCRRNSMLESWELKFPLTRLWPRELQQETELHLCDRELMPTTCSVRHIMGLMPMAVGMTVSFCQVIAPTVSIPDTWRPWKDVCRGAKRKRYAGMVEIAKTHLNKLTRELSEIEDVERNERRRAEVELLDCSASADCRCRFGGCAPPASSF